MLQLLRKDYSLVFPPLSIARYPFIQLSEPGRRWESENVKASKQQERGFEPRLSRLSLAFYHWAAALYTTMAWQWDSFHVVMPLFFLIVLGMSFCSVMWASECWGTSDKHGLWHRHGLSWEAHISLFWTVVCSIKEGLYRIKIICRRHPFWSYPAGLTKADVSPSVCTPLSPSLFTPHQIIYSPALRLHSLINIHHQFGVFICNVALCIVACIHRIVFKHTIR